MFENVYLDLATISAAVAAFVSVVGNAFQIDSRYRALIAILIGVFIVSVPPWLMEKSVMALLIGLTASGLYTQVKKREYAVSDKKREYPPPEYPPANGPEDV